MAFAFAMNPVVCAQDGMPFRIQPELTHGNRLGGILFTGGDVDGDGLPDIFAAETRNGIEWLQWRAFSGLGEALYALEPELSAVPFRSQGAFVGDVDGDQRDDFVIAYHDQENTGPGRVLLHSGGTGEVLLEIHGERPDDVLGRDLTGFCDINNDEIPDFAIVSRAQRDGHVSVISGVDGEVLWRTHVPWARRIKPTADLDGDTIADLAVGMWHRAETKNNNYAAGYGVALLSGRDGSHIRRIMPLSDESGWDFATGFDATGDGVPDFAMMEFGEEVFVIDGATGEHVATFESVVWGLAATDVDGDGDPELFVHTGSGGQATLITSLGHPATTRVIAGFMKPTRASGIYAEETAAADLNGDGFTDVAVGYDRELQVYSGSVLGLGSDWSRAEFAEYQWPGEVWLNVLGRPGEEIHVYRSLGGMDCTVAPRYGVCIYLTPPIQFVTKGAIGDDGRLTLTWDIPFTQQEQTMWFQSVALRDDQLVTSNVLPVTVLRRE